MTDLLPHLQSCLRDHYAIERELGRGGMATVFLAHDLKHGRQVAIKVLHPDLAAALGGERFHREIQIASRLTHPHILPVYDSGEADGSLYYVMPFIEGESLRERITREKQLAIEEALRITCEVSDALSYAHSLGLVHRDIKPENILLSGGHAVVADFGIARAISSAADGDTLTKTGMSLGTPAYMSPEQASAERDIDGRSDLYSLACVAYEMIAGQPPFTAPNAQALMARHALDPVPLLSTVRPAISEEAEDAIMQALEKVPADRFATVGQFAESLRQCAPTGTFAGRTHTRPPTAARRRSGSRRFATRRVAFMAAALVPLVAGGAWAARHFSTRSAGAAGTSVGSLQSRRVAVLYFADRSDDNSLRAVSDGLTESLIDALDQAKLDVISKNGVAQFRQSEAAPDSIARALKAGVLVEGDVQETGDRLKLTVRLIDGASGADFRRGSFQSPKSNVLAVRDSLTQRVALFLREWLGEEVRLRENQEGTRVPAAWVLVQRAEKLRKDTEEQEEDSIGASPALDEADSLLAQAERLDPTYVEAIRLRAAISFARSNLAKAPAASDRWVASGLAHAERALQLNPRDPTALELRGSLKYQRILRNLEQDPTTAKDLLRSAEEDLRAAVAINPAQASAWNAISLLSVRKLDMVEAKLTARRAYEEDAYLTNAIDIIWRLFATSYDLDQPDDASHWCEEGRRRFPTRARIQQCALWVMTMRDRPIDVAQAWRIAEETKKVTPEARRPLLDRESQMLVATVLARASRSEAAAARRALLADSANRVLVRARGNPAIDQEGILLQREAIARTMLGERQEAIRLLKLYLTANPHHRAGMKRNNWWFRELQDDPGFKALIESSDASEH